MLRFAAAPQLFKTFGDGCRVDVVVRGLMLLDVGLHLLGIDKPCHHHKLLQYHRNNYRHLLDLYVQE